MPKKRAIVARFKIHKDRSGWSDVRYKQRIFVNLSTGGYFVVFLIHDRLVYRMEPWEVYSWTFKTFEETLRRGLEAHYDRSDCIRDYRRMRTKERRMIIRIEEP